jgi:CubicO group peptidase (beta-lactamase class C family)
MKRKTFTCNLYVYAICSCIALLILSAWNKKFTNPEDDTSKRKLSTSGEYYPDTTWRTSAPEKQGLRKANLKLFVDSLQQEGAILIIKNGYNVLENYPAKFPRNYFHNMHSFTKSITSTLIEIAIEEGYINSIDDKVVDFFPDIHIKNMDSLKRLITIRHLLTMSGGLDWVENGGHDIDSLYANKVDWRPVVLNRKMAHKPGEFFAYNSAGSHLLSAIVRQKTGMPTNEYAKKKLFMPLGIDSVDWARKAPEGITTGGWGSYFKLADMARMGYLFLENGKWKDKQIISEKWVSEATRKQIDVNQESDDYGYQWWIINEFPKPAFTARGWYPPHYAYVIVIPEKKLIITMAGNVDYYKAKRLIKRYIFNMM